MYRVSIASPLKMGSWLKIGNSTLLFSRSFTSIRETTKEVKSLGSEKCQQFAKMLQESPPKINIAIKYLINITGGLLLTPIIRFMNRFTIYNQDILHEYIFNRTKGKALLTVSNHQSMLDDPGLLAALIPWWRMNPNHLRWGLCTENIFFFNKLVSFIFHAGHVLPLDREGSRDQPLFELFYEKIIQGKWCHIFPEGRIWQNWRFKSNAPRLGPFKTGVGKLILRSYPNDPIILPIYHMGMDKVLPEVELAPEAGDIPSTTRSPFPRGGNDIKVYVGQPFSFHEKIKEFKQKNPDIIWSDWNTNPKELEFQRQITAEIREKMLELERQAYQRS